MLQTLATSPVAWEPAVTGWAASGLAIADLTVAELSTAGSTATTGRPTMGSDLSEISVSLGTCSVAGFLATGSTAARLVAIGVITAKAEIFVGVEGT
jgi:hypothetical protein